MIGIVRGVDVAVVVASRTRSTRLQLTLECLQLALQTRDRVILALNIHCQLLEVDAAVFRLLFVFLDQRFQANVLLDARLQPAAGRRGGK